MKPWKRGLLKAWLALSLLWAAGFTIYLGSILVDLLGGAQISPIVIGVSLLYLLPLGILPPALVLAIGSLIVWLVDRSISNDANH